MADSGIFSRLLVAVFLCLPLFSCGESESVESYRIYRADFSPAMVEGAENLVREIAAKRSLYLYESRSGLEAEIELSSTLWLFRDEQAYHDQNWILTVSTWVDGGTISINVVDHDHSGLSIGFVDGLVSELVG